MGVRVRVGVSLTGAEEVKRPEDLRFRDGRNGVVSDVTVREFHAIGRILLAHRVVIGAPLHQSKEKTPMTAGVEHRYAHIYIYIYISVDYQSILC